MSIDRFFTTTFAVTRMEWSGDSSAEASQGSFLGHIQQAQAETAEYLGEALGKVFSVWCDEDADVEAGDTLTIASGDYAGTYSVNSKQTNATGSSANQHLELTVVKDVMN